MPNTAFLAILQLFFALTWVVYVIYLPALAAQAGIDKRYVPWILMMDQAIFIVCDWAAGVFADRAASVVGRLGRQIAIGTIVSCVAFLAMPWLAPQLGAPAFLAATVIWTVTSSLLRAPPFVLFSRHSSEPRQAWLAGVYLLGFGLAAAAAPFLGGALKNVDPRIPFAIASLSLAVVTIVLVRVEDRGAPAAKPREAVAGERIPPSTVWIFVVGVLLFAIGFQVHFSINSAPAYLRFASPPELERLMPLFWVGFNLVVLPATLLAKRYGGLAVMGAAGLAGIGALYAAARADSLPFLVASQLVAGAAWGVASMSAFTAALETGRVGREGFVTGMLFSMLALAALTRLGISVGNLAAIPERGALLPYVPVLVWALGSLAVAVVATRLRSWATRPA